MLRLLFSLLLTTVDSYKILGLFPHPGKSHSDVFVPLMKGLAEKGHEVTVIGHFPLEKPVARYTDINVADTAVPLVNFVPMEAYVGARIEKYEHATVVSGYAEQSCDAALKSASVQNFLRTHSSQTHFDVIIAEFFNSDCFLGFVHRFKAPLIGLSSCAIMPWTNNRFANPTHPAYIPNVFMDYTDRMDFLERVENSVMGVLHQLFYDGIVSRRDDKISRKYFGENVPSVRDIALNSSLLLVNTHFSLNLPRPLVPAVIDIGGIHVRQKSNRLPSNIEKWINESSDGVIYFSLGSMIKGHTFPEEKRQAFLRAFKRLPQRVLWKWENDAMPGKPDNVMIQKWMPQFDILSHPNVKAFISHGGLLGTIEAVHCGVPMLVMPQYGDQFTNARALEANGGGVLLQLKDADEEKIFSGLSTILSSDFRRKAQELSERFRDRPLPPLDTAIYWVEYVARHRGVHHMRTAAVGMPFYQYYLLDVIALLLGILAVVAAFVFYATRAVLRRLFGGNKKVKKN